MPVYSWPALGLLSHIKIATGMVLTLHFQIASYFGRRRRWTCFMTDTNVAFLRLWNFGKVVESCSQRSQGQTSPTERVRGNEFIITGYSGDTFAFFTDLIELFRKEENLKQSRNVFCSSRAICWRLFRERRGCLLKKATISSRCFSADELFLAGTNQNVLGELKTWVEQSGVEAEGRGGKGRNRKAWNTLSLLSRISNALGWRAP